MADSGAKKLRRMLERLRPLPDDLKSYGIEDFFAAVDGARTEEERYSVHQRFSGEQPPRFSVCDSDLNTQRYLNRYLIAVNGETDMNGLFICSFHSAESRRKEIFANHTYFAGRLVYFFDFLWHRACPKLFFMKKIYFKIYHKVKRVYPVVEVMGRLSYCGFLIRCIREINGVTYVVTQKNGEPQTENRPSYGLFVSIPRVGKHGKIIYVRKIRTMYAYSEFLQGFTFELNELSDGGKIADDFRISGWGRILRKYFIDEIPMFYNVFNGDMKLVGVRPLTRQYFQLYTPEMQAYRTRHKPGMLPPYYVECPHTLEEVQANEKRYLDAYEANRWRTQWSYFWKILYNVLIKRKHSS